MATTANKKAGTPITKKAARRAKKFAVPIKKKASVSAVKEVVAVAPLKPIKDTFTKASLIIHLAERSGVEPKAAKALLWRSKKRCWHRFTKKVRKSSRCRAC